MGQNDEQSIGGRVLYAVTDPALIPSRRYHDKDFYGMEVDLLWPRTWQMACRLEEIPEPGDFVVYEILDQSVVVVRGEDGSVRAFHNACRHRAAKLVDDRGSQPEGFVCPFHGWCYGLDGANTYVLAPKIFESRVLNRKDISLRPCRVETWGGSAFINFDDDAAPLRESLEPVASILDEYRVENMHSEWWHAIRLPVNWKFAVEAFLEGYHVMETHPQLLREGLGPSNATYKPIVGTTFREPPRMRAVDAKAFIDSTLHFLRTTGEGMNGMIHRKDLQVADTLRDLELPDQPELAGKVLIAALNNAIREANHRVGIDLPDFNDLLARGLAFPACHPVYFAFPNYFLLPVWGNAVSYRVRPLGPEECLFEIWSLTHFEEGVEPPKLTTPEWWSPNDPRIPPIPMQDFSNLPRQQIGVHTKGFDHVRLSLQIEGQISNFERMIDGYLAGLGHDQLAPALPKVNGEIETPARSLGFGPEVDDAAAAHEAPGESRLLT